MRIFADTLLSGRKRRRLRSSLTCARFWVRACISLLLTVGSPAMSRSQTYQPTQAIHAQECQSLLGVSNCSTIQTNRISRNFTTSNLASSLFSLTWATASHCTKLSVNNAMCQNAVQAWSDPNWGRIIWSYANTYITSYGTFGGPVDIAGVPRTGTFIAPRGMSMTQREGEWHGLFVADAGHNRIVALALGFDCKCTKWLGVLDGHESGLRMHWPSAVAWDPAGTWSLADDRLFIVDKLNHRVLVYHVALDFTTDVNNPRMTTSYFNSFGSKGSGTNQFLDPEGIAVRTTTSGQLANVYITDTGNHRISFWSYDGSPLVPQTAYSRSVSPTYTGSELTGISMDNYGDLIVVDHAKGMLRTFKGPSLIQVKTFGGTSGWATGNFIRPSSPEVIYAHRQDVVGNRLDIGLPYVGVAESWGDTTGGQLERLGVDADSLAVVVPNTPGARSATLSFLFTAAGSYTASIKNLSGTVVKTLLWNHASYSGWQTIGWDGKDDSGILVPYGSYSALISFVSGYTYDSLTPRTASKSFTLVPLMSTGISGPTLVVKGTSHTWTSSITGGTSPYTYSWKKNGTAVGSSASYTSTTSTCGPFTLSLTVTDSQTHTASASFGVDVTGGSPPCGV